MIYALNTQNGENEDFVVKLRSLHEDEIQRVLLDSSARLQRCEETFSKERGSQIKRIEELRASVETLEGERDKLQSVQVSRVIRMTQYLNYNALHVV